MIYTVCFAETLLVKTTLKLQFSGSDVYVESISSTCFVLFSSPEHNMLRGSYCDRSSSVVRLSVRLSICPSVNNFFKNLLQNQKANLDKTWQECSLGEALQKLLKEFNSNKNSGCHGNKMAENGRNL